MVNKTTDDTKVTKKTTKKTTRRKTSKKKDAAAKKPLSEKERQALALQHIKQLLQMGQKKGSLTYTEIMNLMEEDELRRTRSTRCMKSLPTRASTSSVKTIPWRNMMI